MNGLFRAAAEVQRHLATLGVPFCFIGGVAVLRWGEPRTTRDVDLAVFAGFDREDEVIRACIEQFAPRLGDAAAFARQSRMVLVQTDDSVPIDISLAALPFEEQMMERASEHDFGDGVVLRTCSAEDLVVLKAFAGRSKDWADIEGVVIRHGDSLDRELILRNASLFDELKPEAAMLARLQQLLG